MPCQMLEKQTTQKEMHPIETNKKKIKNPETINICRLALGGKKPQILPVSNNLVCIKLLAMKPYSA